MTGLQPLTARAAALKALNRSDLLRHDTARILNPLLARTDRSAQATDIVCGVIRNRSAIDLVLRKCSKTAPPQVQPALWNLLRMAVYELVYAPKTADYAILNEAVQLAHQGRSAKAAGFVNAVLRNVHRSIESRQAPPSAALLRRMMPQSPAAGCLFCRDLLPDPAREALQYYSAAFSLPQDLIKAWLKTYGPQQTSALCFASNRHPSIVAQPNTLVVTADRLTKKFNDENIPVDQKAGAVRVHGTGRINTSPTYAEGLFYVQDITAARAMRLAEPQPDWTVLDLCAAPGGKCIALALLTNDAATILATDSDNERLQMVRQNIQRLRLQSVQIIPAPRLQKCLDRLKSLDAIVLDVPCSNTGVLARRIEARWRWKPRLVEGLHSIQRDLLRKAAQLARPRTRIIYSTCSIQPEENQQQIGQFLSEHRNYTLGAEALTLPALETEQAFDCDGGYVAVLRPK
ncbi:MAG: hypothetical protein L0Y36_05620 [Planctomycetales bacterium]|nr:hypothetical protein [Planctomycetales bacterium]